MVDATQFQKLIASDFHKGLITRTLAGLPPAVFQRCPTLVSAGSQITVLRPVAFAGSGVPNAGMWKESFPVSGCGNDTTLNLYFVASADEKISAVVGIPGATRADPVLQKDAYFYAALGAQTAAKGCTSFNVKHSTFDGFGTIDQPSSDPGPNNRFRPWHETWMLTGCGRTFAVPIQFAPDDTGTKISQNLGSVREQH